MLAAVNKAPTLIRTSRVSNERIVAVRKQICTVKLQRRTMDPQLYHDQLEELYASLHDLRTQEVAKRADALEGWCVSNPSDFECRTYDA